ncbi:MAG TPA: 16S rRNA pseudouridine(516) synthase [Clostridiales bacterium]|nr:16S rRNA pseudouridine(516) synthase [Clostridiales bacterium]HQK73982.1 16S rRNA pseudouridine(516) synthase [Clostridiales bacterium]
MKKERLDKIVASSMGVSRSEAGKLVRSGAVTLAGAALRNPSLRLDAQAAALACGARELNAKQHVTLMLHKPAGVLSASRDARAKTVVDLLPPEYARRGLFPAGRLDKDATGLLLLTDDGELAHRVISPKKHVWKTYEVLLAAAPDAAQLDAVQNSITLADGQRCLPAVAVRTPKPNVVLVRIREGKYHQIKRMFAAAGNAVAGLKRTAVGGLALDEGLAPGEYRELGETDIARIFEQPAPLTPESFA